MLKVEGVLPCRWTAKVPTALSIEEVRKLQISMYACTLFKLIVVFLFYFVLFCFVFLGGRNYLEVIFNL